MPSQTTTIYSNGGHAYTLSVSFTETDTSTSNNTSTISITGQLIPVSNYWSTSYQSNLSICWHDNRENIDRWIGSLNFAGISQGETKTVTGSITVYHKDDGTLSGYAYVKFEKGSTTSSFAPNSGGIGTDWANLTNIDRYPMITSAPNFTDEENPVITYTTTSGFENPTVYACISLDGTTDNIQYREVNLSNGSYTFELTTAERNLLRNASPNSNNLSVTFILKTVVGGTNYYSKLSRQMSIINANPTFTHTEQEVNSKVVAILGSSASTIVQNASIVRITIVPTALKGATISSVRVVSGLDYGETITTSPYVFDVPVTVQAFVLKVTDSRGNIGSVAISKTLIEYNAVAINSFMFERENPASSNIILNFDGNYMQKNFNTTPNVPTIKWKLDDGSYTTIPSSEYSIDTTDNKITISNYELTNALAYNLQGQFYISLEDLLTEANDGGNNGLVLKGVPTYDVGEHDMQINGDLFIADINADNPVNVLDKIQNKLLWENENPTSDISTKNIQLSSSDYDYLEVIFKMYSSTEVYWSQRFPKGVDARLFSIDGGGNYSSRQFNYVSDTQYQIGTDSSGNNRNIPIYVIGWKIGTI